VESGLRRASQVALVAAAGSLVLGLAASGCSSVSGPGPMDLPAGVKRAIELAIFFGLFYFVFRVMRGTRGEGILKGMATILLVCFFALYYVSQEFKLEHVAFLLERVLSTSIIALLIIFQPELRRGLVRLGESPFVRIFMKNQVSVIDEIVEAVVRLAKKKVGALIAFEREVGLRTYIEGGVKIDSEVRSELLDTVFFPGSALHDGAVVIQDSRIAAAGCLFPLTDNPSISKQLGTRHRAAIGLTEETDAVTVVVSEETGQISVGVDGELHRNLDKESLEQLLRRLILAGDEEKSPAAPAKPPAAPAPAAPLPAGARAATSSNPSIRALPATAPAWPAAPSPAPAPAPAPAPGSGSAPQTSHAAPDKEHAS